MSYICSEVENMYISTNYYEFIKQIYDYVTKYIKNYRNETGEYVKKLVKIQEKFNPRIKGIEELKKIKNIKTKHIISLSSKIFNVIGTQIDNLKIFLKECDDIIKSFDKTLKEKNTMSTGYIHEYEECKNNLQKKYKDIEKAKISYFDHAEQTENLLNNFYYKNPKLKENESNQLVTKAQIDNCIKGAKKYETEYSNLIKTAKSYEDKFLELTDNSNDNMKRISCEIMTKMKDNMINLLINIKNCFKLPIGEIDAYLPELINLDESKKMEDIINSTFKKDNSLIRMETKLYNIKIIPKTEDNENEDDNIYLIEDDKILKIVKTMEDNFTLIEKGCIEKINTPEKLRTRFLTYKFLSFSDKIKNEIKKLESNGEINNINNINNNNIIKNEIEDYSITDEEVKELLELLKILGNKMIFIRKINNFRRFGNLEFPNREFGILCNIFNIFSKEINEDKNFEAQLSLIILSETYYKLENNKKIYILTYIKNNPVFHEKNFWNDFINKSILKEVQRNLKIEMNAKKGVMINEKKNFTKLAFAQILPIIKTMIEFELKQNLINELLEDLVSYYQLGKEEKSILFELINFKGTEKQKEIKDKCQKYLELSSIMEDENEYRESVYEAVNTINNIKLKKQKKEDNEEDKEESENIEKQKEEKEEKEEDNLNNKMIKNVTSDEFEAINAAMIKDGIEEENEEEEEINEKEIEKKEEN